MFVSAVTRHLTGFLVQLYSVTDGHRLAATLAAQSAIGCQAGLSGSDSCSRKLFRNVAASAKVHLVESLAMKGGMRQMGVVLLDVKRDQLPYRRHAIERVQVQPLMFENSPPGFDHRIRELDVSLGENWRGKIQIVVVRSTAKSEPPDQAATSRY